MSQTTISTQRHTITDPAERRPAPNGARPSARRRGQPRDADRTPCRQRPAPARRRPREPQGGPPPGRAARGRALQLGALRGRAAPRPWKRRGPPERIVGWPRPSGMSRDRVVSSGAPDPTGGGSSSSWRSASCSSSWSRPASATTPDVEKPVIPAIVLPARRRAAERIAATSAATSPTARAPGPYVDIYKGATVVVTDQDGKPDRRSASVSARPRHELLPGHPRRVRLPLRGPRTSRGSKHGYLVVLARQPAHCDHAIDLASLTFNGD